MGADRFAVLVRHREMDARHARGIASIFRGFGQMLLERAACVVGVAMERHQPFGNRGIVQARGRQQGAEQKSVATFADQLIEVISVPCQAGAQVVRKRKPVELIDKAQRRTRIVVSVGGLRGQDRFVRRFCGDRQQRAEHSARRTRGGDEFRHAPRGSRLGVQPQVAVGIVRKDVDPVAERTWPVQLDRREPALEVGQERREFFGRQPACSERSAVGGGQRESHDAPLLSTVVARHPTCRQ